MSFVYVPVTFVARTRCQDITVFLRHYSHSNALCKHISVDWSCNILGNNLKSHL